MKKREMYYYCQNGENFEKWLIGFDEEELMRIREEVFEKCSYITHEEKDYISDPVKNYREGCVRNVKVVKETSRYSKCYSFDLYHPKLLVDIIDALLKGEPSAIDELDNPRPTEEKFDFAPQIAAKSSEIDAIPNDDAERKIAALKEYQKLTNEAKLNENQGSALDYYPLVQSLITRKLMDTIAIGEILRTTCFFDKGVDIFSLTSETKNKDNIRLRLIPKV